MIKNRHLKLLYLIHASLYLSFAADRDYSQNPLNETLSYSSPSPLIFSPIPLSPLSSEFSTWGAPLSSSNPSVGHPYYSSNGLPSIPYPYYFHSPTPPPHSSYYPLSPQDNGGYDGSISPGLTLPLSLSPHQPWALWKSFY